MFSGGIKVYKLNEGLADVEKYSKKYGQGFLFLFQGISFYSQKIVRYLHPNFRKHLLIIN